MVKRVEAMFTKDGADATFKAVSDKSVADFHDRDFYPFVYDMRGNCVAHGARPALYRQEPHGSQGPGRQISDPGNLGIANGPGSGWVDYRSPTR